MSDRSNLTVIDYFKQQVEIAPQAIALVEGDQSMTFEELNRRSDALCDSLLAQGVTPEDLVGVCVPRSIELIVSVIGILKSGAAYLPIQSDYPQARIQHILKDAAVEVMVTNHSTGVIYDTVSALSVKIIGTNDTVGDSSKAALKQQLLENLAYCIYTSGTTGTPKGVAVTHKNLLSYCLTAKDTHCLKKGDKVLLFSSICFDASIGEIFPTLIAGATVVISPEEVLSPVELCQFSSIHQVTVISLPTSYWHALVDQFSQCEEVWPTSLRLMSVGGEKLLLDRFDVWRQLPQSQQIQWIFDYGPTETTFLCCSHEPQCTYNYEVMPIGQAMPNAHIYILNEDLEPVSGQEVGEIYISGEGVSRGYLHQSSLTAGAFLPDPFSTLGKRMYKSGDQARFNQRGDIEFIGRIDNQVKVMGHRIELGEIESVLLRHQKVSQAFATLFEQGPQKKVVVYICANALAESELREFAIQHLPKSMRYLDFVITSNFPLNPINGKINKQLLEQMYQQKSSLTNNPIPPEFGIERALAELWFRVTGSMPNGAEDEHFFYTADSLNALKFLTYLSEALGWTITYSELPNPLSLRNLKQVVNNLAKEVEDSCENDVCELDIIERIENASSYTITAEEPNNKHSQLASNAQQRLWFLMQTQAQSATYSMPLAFKLQGDLDISRFEQALNLLIQKHEVLRTGFEWKDNQLWQNIMPNASYKSTTFSAASEKEAMNLLNNCAKQSHDIENGDIVHSYIIKVSDSLLFWFVSVHHIACDAISYEVFFEQLGALYKDQSTQAQSVVSQYVCYSQWQSEWLKSEHAQQQLNYWKEQLPTQIPTLNIANNSQYIEARTFTGDIEPIHLNKDEMSRVESLSHQYKTSVFNVLLACYISTLYRVTQQDELITGVPMACRNRLVDESTLGFFANTLPIYTDMSDLSNFADVLARVSASMRGAIANQELPFDAIIDGLKIERPPGVNPLFQNMFVLEASEQSSRLELDNIEVIEQLCHSGTAKMDLTFSLRLEAGTATGEVEFSTDVWSKATAKAFIKGFKNLLADVGRNPNKLLNSLSMLCREDATEVVNAVNQKSACFEDLKPIHQYFEEQVQKTPNATAIATENESISYLELNARANYLAQQLCVSGIAVGDVLGVCVERSLDLAVALLASLKAGAAFIPLDPRAPLGRLEEICQDARPPLIIASDSTRKILDSLNVNIICPESRVQHKNLNLPIHILNAAFIYYTSGSSGKPKGVVVDHSCAMTRLSWLKTRYPLEMGESVVHKTPLIFDVAIWEIFGPLMSGATVLMSAPNAESDVEHIAQLITSHHTVFVHFVPSMLEAFLQANIPLPEHNLKWISLSGEAVSSRLFNECRQHYAVQLDNLYGQTETSEVAGWWAEEAPLEFSSAPLGYQIGAYRLFILDDELNPVPINVPGQLYVAGVGGLSRGYLNNPELTADKFIPNPYSLEYGERLYATGDLACLNEHGFMLYLGRIDNQVKIRGCRVDIAEVETALMEHELVNSCTVNVNVAENGQKELLAYVVSEQSKAVKKVSQFLEHKLPSFMLPAAYIQLDALPLTPSGKLDRRNLPLPTSADYKALSSFEPVETTLEQSVLEIWTKVLKVESIGRNDPFNIVGGNSLKLLQVNNIIKEKYLITISINDFYKTPTIAAMAALLEQGIFNFVSSMSDQEVANYLTRLN
ncbi:non-ribosomal peptide synthetase [Pseudoalteromonas luteoviolacea]|uniref:Carrier domain-containing protein n=1 Tax=Pseudoalteromonas luteoviolacea NCIMB 1942 TaxID=1365253 RepID=A0A167CLQ0_9GAMM|nr:non-ribosomal peptide synthetase [Pseudoalteromonas luteoviolacea]KZN47812.1 hypothetical protein N482_08855 [Pseudoalteromonas luteoviolacea NCIMB 1942]